MKNLNHKVVTNSPAISGCPPAPGRNQTQGIICPKPGHPNTCDLCHGSLRERKQNTPVFLDLLHLLYRQSSLIPVPSTWQTDDPARYGRFRNRLAARLLSKHTRLRDGRPGRPTWFCALKLCANNHPLAAGKPREEATARKKATTGRTGVRNAGTERHRSAPGATCWRPGCPPGPLM